MTTMKDIANRLGISVGSVSKGINGAHDISPELQQIILDTAVEMGYVSKKMKKKENRKLAIFIENMGYESSDQFGHDIILGFKQSASRNHWDVEVIPVTPLLQRQEKYDTYMLKNGYSGAFAVGFALQDEWLEQITNTAIPTALFDNYVKRNANVAYVGTDSFEGIDMVIEHLALMGHKRIAFLNGSAHSMISEHRMQAFRESMQRRELPIDEDMVTYAYFVAEVARDHVPRYLQHGATAIVCGNDLIASGVIKECAVRGVRVPDEVSVVGFDDLPLSAGLYPPLTTIRQDRLELGKCGFYALNSLIHHIPVSTNLLRPQFMIRNSTAEAIQSEGKV